MKVIKVEAEIEMASVTSNIFNLLKDKHMIRVTKMTIITFKAATSIDRPEKEALRFLEEL